MDVRSTAGEGDADMAGSARPGRRVAAAREVVAFSGSTNKEVRGPAARRPPFPARNARRVARGAGTRASMTGG